MKTTITILAALAIGAGSLQAQQYYSDFRNSSNSPHIYSPRGEYLGNLNRNQFDPNSISNPFGAGRQFKADGVNNQFSPNYAPNLMPRRGR